VEIDESITEKEIMKMIDPSYSLVCKGLKKSEREKLEQME